MRILIVDDEPYMLWLYQRLKSTHEVTWSYGYDEAIDLLQKNSFDLAVVDILMPARPGSQDPEEDSQRIGLDLCKEILETHAGRCTRIIVISVLTEPEFVERARKAGLDHRRISFCSKQPISHLQQFIEKAVAELSRN